MHIDENTKISKIINDTPEAIDAIVSLSKHFEKLRIPILRKTLASRVTIKQASKIGGVSIYDFYNKLSPLGFTFETSAAKNVDDTKEEEALYINNFENGNIEELDVRGILKQNKDPFNIIMDSLEKLPDGYTLNIINTFEPIPLINILSKKGYTHQTIYKDKQLVHTYFKKQISTSKTIDLNQDKSKEESAELLKKYKTNIKEIDVRNLEMPLPMSTILNELLLLQDDYLLFVHHKKVPKFLFPELSERGYKWHIQEIKEDDVKLYIFK